MLQEFEKQSTQNFDKKGKRLKVEGVKKKGKGKYLLPTEDTMGIFVASEMHCIL